MKSEVVRKRIKFKKYNLSHLQASTFAEQRHVSEERDGVVVVFLSFAEDSELSALGRRDFFEPMSHLLRALVEREVEHEQLGHDQQKSLSLFQIQLGLSRFFFGSRGRRFLLLLFFVAFVFVVSAGRTEREALECLDRELYQLLGEQSEVVDETWNAENARTLPEISRPD